MNIPALPALQTDKLFVDGEWVSPSISTTYQVIDSTNEEPFLEIALGGAPDIDRAIAAAREAFDNGPWPRLTPQERAVYVRAIAAEWRRRLPDVQAVYPREVGATLATTQQLLARATHEYETYAAIADEFEFDKRMRPTAGGEFALLSYEPVGVVAAIVPWNAPVSALGHKIGAALTAGCTMVLRVSREAPAEAYIAAEIAETVGLPRGVLNVVITDRTSSELLVTDPRVDKIAFTGSTATGKHLAALASGHMARLTLELGGKSAAVILDDADIEQAARTLAAAECRLTGQVCASMTRLVVDRSIHDDFSEAMAEVYRGIRVGDPYDPETQIGPLSSASHRDRVEGYIRTGIEEGCRLLAGGARPAHLDRGFYVEPTLFAAPHNRVAIAQEEIFGPVVTIIEAQDEDDAVRIANDTIFGLNASVFTRDRNRALSVARRLQSGTVGHNAQRTDFGIAFGGFKQSGIGREGGEEGLRAYLEPKTIILDEVPEGF